MQTLQEWKGLYFERPASRIDHRCPETEHDRRIQDGEKILGEVAKQVIVKYGYFFLEFKTPVGFLIGFFFSVIEAV